MEPADRTTKILIVDDHRVVREGVRILFEQQTGFEIVGEASTAEELAEMELPAGLDVVLMDLHLPGENGIVSAQRLLQRRPNLKIIMLTSTAEPTDIFQAFSAGIAGYIVKENAWEDLGRAVRAVRANKFYLCPDAVTAIFPLAPPRTAQTDLTTSEHLSDRDVRILTLVAEGRRNKEIADLLNLTVKSVETYRSRLMTRLDCQSPADLVRFAIRRGLIQA